MIRKLPFTVMLFLSTTVLSPVYASEVADEPEADSETIIVNGTVYRGEVSSGGARIDAEVKDLPLSISVVTQELIEDRQIRNLRQLADSVAGVSARSGGPGAFSNDFVLRGFSAFASGTAINGFRSDGFVAAREPQHMERVEFLKGPGSVLYGASGALGGTVNYVTKTPQAKSFADLSVTGGAFGYGRATADINQNMGDTFGVRLNAAITTEESLTAFQNTESLFAAPIIRWKPASNLTVLAEGFYFKGIEGGRESSSRPALPISLTLDRRFKIGEPGTYRKLENYGGRLDVQYEIAAGLTLRQGLYWAKAISDGLDQFPDPSFGGDNSTDLSQPGLFASPTSFTRGNTLTQDTNRDLSSQTELRWNFDLGGTSHKLLAGVEYANNRFGPYFFFDGPLAPIDFLNPIYGAQPGTLNFSFAGQSAARTYAAYIQDFIEIGQFKLLAGLRYDDVKATAQGCSSTPECNASSDPLVNGLTTAPESALSPRLGLVYQPSEATTLYASWSRSFNPNPFPDRNGNILPAERGEQYEIGVKQGFVDGKVFATLALFDLVRQNVLTDDPTDILFQIAVGEQRSRGVEFELAGKPFDALDIVATYAYIDAKVTKDNVIPVGSRLSEAPRHSASLFGKLDIGGGTAFSAGAYYTGARETLARPDVLQLKSAIRFDLGLFQEIGDRLRLQANITNLTNKRIIDPSNQGVLEQSPRRITVGASVRF
jgi:iron complex outermembrane recepter protein